MYPETNAGPEPLKSRSKNPGAASLLRTFSFAVWAAGRDVWTSGDAPRLMSIWTAAIRHSGRVFWINGH